METHPPHLLLSPQWEVLDQKPSMLRAFGISVGLPVNSEPVSFVAYRNELEISVLEQRTMDAAGARIYADP